MLSRGEVFFAPAVWDPVTARLARHAGFKALYVPADETGIFVGEARELTTLTQTVMVAERALEGVDDELPMIVDVRCASVAETRLAVRTLEDASITAMHLEDTSPAGEESVKSYQNRINAAVSTRKNKDFMIIAGINGVDPLTGGVRARNGVLGRAQSAVEAGADVLFIKGMRPGTDDMQYFRSELKHVPMAAVPGNGESLSLDDYRSRGYQLVLYPRVIQPAMQAVHDVYRHVKDTESLPVIPQEQLDDVMSVWWTLVGMEEKWAVEAATTEVGKA